MALAASAVDEVFRGIGDDDVDNVTRLLDANPDLLKATAWSFNKTLLMHAAERGQGNMVALLLAREAGINARDMFEDTALHYAAQFGHEGVASLLLDGGSDVRSAGFAGLTALMLASVRGHVGVFRVLLQRMGRRGLDERSANGSTALLLACVNGRVEPVQALLEAGADHSIPNDRGQTPEQIARKYGRRDCARFLEIWDMEQVERERVHTLQKARRVSDEAGIREHLYGAYMPAPFPLVDVLSMQQKRRKASRWAVQVEEEEEEMWAMAEYVVKGLDGHLYVELLDGLWPQGSAGEA